MGGELQRMHRVKFEMFWSETVHVFDIILCVNDFKGNISLDLIRLSMHFTAFYSLHSKEAKIEKKLFPFNLSKDIFFFTPTSSLNFLLTLPCTELITWIEKGSDRFLGMKQTKNIDFCFILTLLRKQLGNTKFSKKRKKKKKKNASWK